MRKIDYSTFNSPQNENDYKDKRWWLEDKKDISQCVVKIVKQLSEYDTRRQTQYQISTRLYGNANLVGLNGLSYTKIASIQNANKDRISYNVVQSCIDTITAKIGKNKPKPMFLTSGGDYKIQRKAKKLDKFVDGVFYENEAHSLGSDLFRDACIFGDGLLHVFAHHGRVKYERVLPSEIYVDFVESFYGEPRQLHRVKNIDRLVLADLFPKFAKEIADVSSASADLTGAYQNVADQVAVVESWHLPSGPDAGDGVHTINIENACLFHEKWEKDFFPFAKLAWSKRVYGFWGQGLAEQIQNIQVEINKILWLIQRSMHLAGTFKVFLQNGSKVVQEKLNNDIGAIISYTGQEPKYVVPPIVPMELYQHLITLKNSAFEQCGISQLSASSQKPAGLNSGKALREYNDIESERFMTVGQAYEKFFMDIAKLTVSVAKEIYEEEGKLTVKIPGKRFIETIDWKEVNMKDDEFILKIFPVSSLPQDPAGRLQTIQEYAQAGFIDPRTARRLLEFPDLEQVENLQNAQEEWIHDIMAKIIDDGEYTPPEPFDNLQEAREIALEYYTQGKMNALEEEKLEMLRTFIDQVGMLEQKAMPPAPPAMGGAPQANPMPAPQSELLPNVPQAPMQ